jgi:hypothetical protein
MESLNDRIWFAGDAAHETRRGRRPREAAGISDSGEDLKIGQFVVQHS